MSTPSFGPDAPTEVLLHAWHGGDEGAFQRLVARHLPWIRAHVGRRLGRFLAGRADADDYVQEVVIDALRYGPRFRLADEEQFRALLGRIVENVLRDENDRHRAQRRAIDREQPLARDSVLELDGPRRHVTRPSEAAVRDERQAWVRLALECLPDDDRRLILAREWEDRPFADIAAELGTTEDAARMRFNRAVLRLAEQLARLRSGRVMEAIAAADAAR